MADLAGDAGDDDRRRKRRSGAGELLVLRGGGDVNAIGVGPDGQRREGESEADRRENVGAIIHKLESGDDEAAVGSGGGEGKGAAFDLAGAEKVIALRSAGGSDAVSSEQGGDEIGVGDVADVLEEEPKGDGLARINGAVGRGKAFATRDNVGAGGGEEKEWGGVGSRDAGAVVGRVRIGLGGGNGSGVGEGPDIGGRDNNGDGGAAAVDQSAQIGGNSAGANGDGALGGVGRDESDAGREGIIDEHAGSNAGTAIGNVDGVSEVAAEDDGVRGSGQGEGQVGGRADGGGGGGGIVVKERIGLIGASGGGGGDVAFEERSDMNGDGGDGGVGEGAETANDLIARGRDGGGALRRNGVEDRDTGGQSVGEADIAGGCGPSVSDGSDIGQGLADENRVWVVKETDGQIGKRRVDVGEDGDAVVGRIHLGIAGGNRGGGRDELGNGRGDDDGSGGGGADVELAEGGGDDTAGVGDVALGNGGGNEDQAAVEHLAEHGVFGGARTEIGDGDRVNQIAADKDGFGSGDHADGQVHARTLAAAVGALSGEDGEGPALDGAGKEKEAIHGVKAPEAIDVGAGFAAEDGEPLIGRVGADERSEAGADGIGGGVVEGGASAVRHAIHTVVVAKKAAVVGGEDVGGAIGADEREGQVGDKLVRDVERDGDLAHDGGNIGNKDRGIHACKIVVGNGYRDVSTIEANLSANGARDESKEVGLGVLIGLDHHGKFDRSAAEEIGSGADFEEVDVGAAGTDGQVTIS